ncbi:uncharacterized protein [Typha latifolia]|uniref:uncharacterized protein n=1 Tax=Typha latifolia TaxID=4733 RepID=UPI003C2F47E6
MADEVGERGRGRMDLNLYLWPQNRDVVSDLAISPFPWTPSSAEENHDPASISAPLGSSIYHAPYSPSNSLYIPDQLSTDPTVAYGDNQSLGYASQWVCQPDVSQLNAMFTSSPAMLEIPYDSPASFGVAQGSNVHVPYLPVCPPSSRIPQQDGNPASVGPILLIPVTDLVASDDRSSSQQPLQEYPQLRFQRLIEVSHRWGVRQSGQSDPHDTERLDSIAHPVTSPERLMHDIVSSQRSLDASRKNKLQAEGKEAMGSDRKKEESFESAANYDCNICFDMAQEPVVTPCGHLFCWSCLYIWLHAHSENSDCPVCKGEVLEVNVTPIYGRGGPETTLEKKQVEDGDSGLKIPPRPHANRKESLRQQLQRPASRRLTEGTVISWRQIMDEHLQRGAESQRPRTSRLLGRFDAVHPTVLTRLRPRRMQTGERHGSDSGFSGLAERAALSLQTDSAHLLFQDEVDYVPQPSLGHATSMNRLVVTASSSGDRQAEASSSSVNPHDTESLFLRPQRSATVVDQASTSSTIAIIEGETSSTQDLAGPNRAGHSRSLRSRGSRRSASFDVDGGELYMRRRRRQN